MKKTTTFRTANGFVRVLASIFMMLSILVLIQIPTFAASQEEIAQSYEEFMAKYSEVSQEIENVKADVQQKTTANSSPEITSSESVSESLSEQAAKAHNDVQQKMSVMQQNAEQRAAQNTAMQQTVNKVVFGTSNPVEQQEAISKWGSFAEHRGFWIFLFMIVSGVLGFGTFLLRMFIMRKMSMRMMEKAKNASQSQETEKPIINSSTEKTASVPKTESSPAPTVDIMVEEQFLGDGGLDCHL